MPTILNASLLATTALVWTGPADAQTASPAPEAIAEESDEAIVVVGKLTDSAITREDIELAQANDLRDLFRDVPSVSVGGSLGIAQKVYVRGLEDSLLNISIDGAQQQGTLFHHIGRVSIEPELLEHVEVQTGAGEATSGFGAIGGAIRFRTRDAADLLAPGRDIGGIVKAGWFSNDGHKLSATLYARIAGDVGIIGSFVHSNLDEFRDGDGNEVRGTAAEQNLGFVKLGGELGGGHRISLSYEQRDEKGAFGARPNWPVLAADALYPAEARRRTAIANYGHDTGGALSVEATGYWTRAEFELDRYDRWGLYGAEIENWGADLRLRARFADHDVTLGAEYRSDSVASEYRGDPAAWQPWAWDPAIGRFDERGALFGVYLQDRWRVFEPLLLSFGARYDSYRLEATTYGAETDSDGFSFNIGADYEIVPGLTANAGYAQAFRGKEIGDAFTLEHRPGRDIFAPGLKPERVGNFEAGIAYDRDGLFASIAYFDMKIEDVILDQLYSGPPPQDGVYFENVGTFRSDGIELRGGYRTGIFGISAYYNHYSPTLNDAPINGYEHLALGNTLGDNWNVTANIDPTPSLGLQASLTRFERVEDLEVLFRDVALGYIPATATIDKPAYAVVDLFGRWQPFGDERLTLLAGVYNLFDETYLSHASVGDYTAIPDYEIVSGLPEAGRNVRLTASVRF